jgi:hypothetical protein
MHAIYICMHYRFITLHAFIYGGRIYFIYMSLQKLNQEMSSIRISHKAKSRLAKIGARLTLKDGNTRSMEEIIDLLVDYWEKEHKGET